MGTRKASRKTPKPVLKPRYDISQHTLYVGEIVVKRIKQPSDAQVVVFMEFERQGWPRMIVNPLAASAKSGRKHRRQNVVDNLNDNQQTKLIHFYFDGYGNIGWELNPPK